MNDDRHSGAKHFAAITNQTQGENATLGSPYERVSLYANMIRNLRMVPEGPLPPAPAVVLNTVIYATYLEPVWIAPPHGAALRRLALDRWETEGGALQP